METKIPEFDQVIQELQKLFPSKQKSYLEDRLKFHKGKVLPTISEVSDTLGLGDDFDQRLRQQIVARYQMKTITLPQELLFSQRPRLNFGEEIEFKDDSKDDEEENLYEDLVEALMQEFKKYRKNEQDKNSIRLYDGSLKVVHYFSMQEQFYYFLEEIEKLESFPIICGKLKLQEDPNLQVQELQSIKELFQCMDEYIIDSIYQKFPNKSFVLGFLKKEFECEYLRKYQEEESGGWGLESSTKRSKKFLNKAVVDDFLNSTKYSTCSDYFFKFDFHRFSVVETQKVADDFLDDIYQQIQSNKLIPNYHQEHHIICFICGAGKNSSDPSRLIKNHLFQHLKNRFGGEERLHFDYWDGNIYVDMRREILERKKK